LMYPSGAATVHDLLPECGQRNRQQQANQHNAGWDVEHQHGHKSEQFLPRLLVSSTSSLNREPLGQLASVVNLLRLLGQPWIFSTMLMIQSLR